MTKIAIIVTCEHAVNSVPQEYFPLFYPYQPLLSTHRGVDLGALEIAKHLQHMIPCVLIQATTTRLLIDCNRSLNNPACFSEITKPLNSAEKQKIINNYYVPYREDVIHHIKTYTHQGLQVLHLSIHSFTSIMENTIRNADISFLYDPQRPPEKMFAKQWQHKIKQITPEYRIRMNYPYKGTSDGLTSTLRKQFSMKEYIGIEVESNQNLVENMQSLNRLKNILSESLFTLIS